ncbi:DedA family protein [Salinithrix halophila]|uniref:DedA family protein n=1 Tax=Salinithrix halophila TaxID=1485204 RepID=A0ABV8JC06_9BACL
MVEDVLHWVVQYGYIGLFCALMLGIIGLPVPDEILMTFTGYLVSKGLFHFGWTVGTAFAGSLTGMSVSFFAGRKLGLPFLKRYGFVFRITPKKLDRAQGWFCRFGSWAIPFGYFIPGVRHFTAYSAGISRWSYVSFSVYAASGALFWVLTFVTLGTLLGDHWQVVTELIHRWMVLGGAVFVGGGLLLWWSNKKRFFGR